MGNIGKVETAEFFDESKNIDSEKAGACCGHTYCKCNNKRAAGITAFVIGVLLVIFAVVLASGVFGVGKMAFIAGGLTIASMFGFGIAAYLLLPKPPKIVTLGSLKNL